MPEDEFKLTYPCYFLYGTDGESLICNPIANHQCLCLFTSPETVQRFQQAKNLYMHGPEHVDLQVPVYVIEDYEMLIGGLKHSEADLAKSGIRHISIDPVPGQPTMYVEIREFISELLK
jgi:hypothetical protein